VLDLYRRATRPSRLRTVVVWQHDAAEALDPRVTRLPGLELIDVPARDSQGCNWARRLGQQAWADEPFTLMLDSHHRFVPGWDDLLQGMHDRLRTAGVAKPLLTAYLPAYEPARDPHGRRRAPTRLRAAGRDAGVLTRLVGDPVPHWCPRTAPLPAAFLSLHLVFAAGAFHREVEMDPAVYFTGDEVLTGMRAYTAGYDLYHPHRVVGWHSYDRASRAPHWGGPAEWERRQRASLAVLRGWYRPATGPAGPGVRTVADYEAQIGVRLVEPADIA
jgi:hypothetical protein